MDRGFCERFGLFVDANSAFTRVWVSDDTDMSVIDFIRFVADSELTVTRCLPADLAAKIHGHFFNGEKITPSNSRSDNPILSAPVAETSRVVRRVHDLIAECINTEASDIHLEAGPDGLLCRARIDGVLRERERIPARDAAETISRIKIMSGLDIAEKRRPQDGRIRFEHGQRLVDIRVSIIPCDFGEKAVLRILDKDTLRLDLSALGFSPDQRRVFEEKISLPNGIILVTGPTGSGKTTTLYAALNYLRSPAVNISTVEDPIEYNLDGINQTQVKPEIGLTFSAMLRSLLRQDPDIIMVGEIRDPETLEIAIRASLTGHLVLSTIHTNSAIATVTRLLDMGAEAPLLASSLRLVVAQRLVRRNCRVCLKDSLSEANKAAARRLGLSEDTTSAESAGCSACGDSGFKGRTAVYELLPITDRLRQVMVAGGTERELLDSARQEGFQPMLASAEQLVRDRITTPLELLRELSA